MTDLMRTLYTYTQENLIPTYLANTRYRHYYAIAGQKESKLLELLPEEGKKFLDEYSDLLTNCHSIEMEVMFRAGVTVGLELSRL